ncbi:hypothetical protein BT69DRAFT_865989 [Atractiella rhizophila]|nr:hypothetical protein BT69DRAFT_865989 [Atractiella rhizophila]
MFPCIGIALLGTFFFPPWTHAQQIDKPYHYPDGLGGLFAYNERLPTRCSTVNIVDPPQQCLEYGVSFIEKRYCNGTMAAINVTYNDCEMPWTICRCDDAPMSFDTLIRQFGRLPVNLRDYVKYLVAFNGPRSGFSDRNNMVMFGDMSDESGLTVFAHEAGHDIDQGVSASAEWAAAVNADSCVPDAYAATNLVEDFAQVNVVSLYLDLYNDIAPAGTSVSCMSNQLEIFRNSDRLNAQAMRRDTCDIALRESWNSNLRRRDKPTVPRSYPIPTPVYNAMARRKQEGTESEEDR